MSLLKSLFPGWYPDEAQTGTESEPKGPVCPVTEGEKLKIIKNRVDFEVVEIEVNSKDWWDAYGNAVVTLPGNAVETKIVEIVNAKYGSVEGFSVHYKTGDSDRAVKFGDEYRFDFEDPTDENNTLYVRVHINEVVINKAGTAV